MVNGSKEFIKRCQNGDEQACWSASAADINITFFTGLTNPYNFVDQSYSFDKDDYETYLMLPKIRQFKLSEGSIATIAMTYTE